MTNEWVLVPEDFMDRCEKCIWAIWSEQGVVDCCNCGESADTCFEPYAEEEE